MAIRHFTQRAIGLWLMLFVIMVHISGGTQLLDPQKIWQEAEIAERQTVADLGCGGVGHFVIPAARLVGEDGTVYAVDILKSVLQNVASRARLEGYKNVKTVWSNLEVPGATKVADKSLNAATLINILFQSKGHEEILREAKRMLKGEGTLVIVDWKKESKPFGPPTVDRVNPNELKKKAIKVGFSFVKEFEAGPYHFGLVFVKPV